MIKKIFIICSLIFILSGSLAYAQSTPAECGSSTEISTGNYPICCPSSLPGLSERCTKFIVQLCTAAPSHALCTGGRIPQQIGGQPTSPINGGGTIGGSSSVGSDKSQYSNVNTCDAIKLNSAINILIWAKCLIAAVIIPLIFALAFMFFLIGVFRFMTADTPDKKKNGQHLVWWGLLGLFVMVSVWGIIKIAGDILGTGEVVPFLQTDYLSTKNTNP